MNHAGCRPWNLVVSQTLLPSRAFYCCLQLMQHTVRQSRISTFPFFQPRIWPIIRLSAIFHAICCKAGWIGCWWKSSWSLGKGTCAQLTALLVISFSETETRCNETQCMELEYSLLGEYIPVKEAIPTLPIFSLLELNNRRYYSVDRSLRRRTKVLTSKDKSFLISCLFWNCILTWSFSCNHLVNHKLSYLLTLTLPVFVL